MNHGLIACNVDVCPHPYQLRRMHEAVLADARSRPDVCGVRLYVEETNRIAQAVYQRVGLRPSSYTVYENDFVFPIRTSLQDCPDEA